MFYRIFSIDGGVSNNDFVMQLISDLTQAVLKKPVYQQLPCIGVTFMAGLSAGIWNSYDELPKLVATEKMYMPQDTWAMHRSTFYNWERALRRLGRWYKTGDR